MKALTVQQPWAWAIIHGGKLVENRTADWSYRGPLAIHAGKRWSERGAADGRVIGAWLDANPSSRARELTSHLLREGGVILGVVDLVDLHPDTGDTGCCRPWGESSYTEAGGRTRRLVTHLVFENPRALDEPIPCKGALGLWTPPADVVAQLEA